MPSKLNVLSGGPKAATGGTFRAPLSTVLPTDATTALEAAFKDAGYVSDEGLTMAIAKAIEKIRAWDGSPVKIIQTEHDVTFTWTYLEFGSVESLKAFFGDDNVTETATTIAILVNATVVGASKWVFEIADGPTSIRVVVPYGELSGEGGEIVFAKTDAIRIPMSIEAMPDDAGNKAYIYQVTTP